jgi:hypothetical protein
LRGCKKARCGNGARARQGGMTVEEKAKAVHYIVTKYCCIVRKVRSLVRFGAENRTVPNFSCRTMEYYRMKQPPDERYFLNF